MEWNENENDLKNKHEPILENIDPNVYKFSRWSDGEYENLDPLLSKVGDKFNFQQRKWMTQLEHQVANKSLNENKEKFSLQIWQNIINKNVPKTSLPKGLVTRFIRLK